MREATLNRRGRFEKHDIEMGNECWDDGQRSVSFIRVNGTQKAGAFPLMAVLEDRSGNVVLFFNEQPNYLDVSAVVELLAEHFPWGCDPVVFVGKYAAESECSIANSVAVSCGQAVFRVGEKHFGFFPKPPHAFDWRPNEATPEDFYLV